MHDYLLALIGGIMIGSAAVLLMAAHGKIMGVSGIVKQLLPPTASDWQWRALFIAGTVIAPLFTLLLTGKFPDVTITTNPGVLLIGGLIVGVGTALGNGCTSGHGVCGMSRLSARSIIATCVFMVTAIITVYVVRHF